MRPNGKNRAGAATMKYKCLDSGNQVKGNRRHDHRIGIESADIEGDLNETYRH
jgi:hypothetical protein